MNTGLHSADCIKFTDSNDYACSLCGRQIPIKNFAVQDWQSVEVQGMFCSEKHAIEATMDRVYRAKFAFKEVN